ncbi:unnamed protein product [Timema podura]|uniref:Uncharacterized protein n=1 Tax=Timema podura TaxID=61482 RepID=A0ABN7NMS4_TIMPD|nr:unnamed protein product [Timema podura]
MVKLTPDLIQQSMQFINPVRDRELDLRGYKIPVIENMGATLDQFDTIDLSDNDIRKLDGFPLLKRLKCLLLNNNRVVRLSEGLETSLPNLETLVLTGNLVQELADLDALVPLKNLRTLSCLQNPVTAKPHYRLYVAFKLPQVKLLDFRKIKLKEREEANSLFKSKKGKELQKEIAKKAKTFVPGAGLPESTKPSGPSPEELWKIREAISKASSLEEVERLNRLLQAGQIPGRSRPYGQSTSSKAPPAAVTEEDDEEEEPMDTDQGVNGR